MNKTSDTRAHGLGGGLLLLVLGIVVVIAASENPWLTDSGAVGPAAVPGTCGALLALLGAVQVGFALRVRRRSALEFPGEAAVAAGGPATMATSTTAPEPRALDLDIIDTGDGANRLGLHEEHPDTASPAAHEGGLRQALLASFGVLVAAIAFNHIGALLTVTLLTAYLLAVVGRKSWRTTAIYTAALIGAVYLIFVVILGIPLPTNPWMG